MKFAVIVFPGSNCDMDMLSAVTDILGEKAEYVQHYETSLAGLMVCYYQVDFLMATIYAVVQLLDFQRL